MQPNQTADLLECRPVSQAMTDDRRPIGVFDSGLGGLSVLAAMRAALPAEVPMADAVFNVAHAALLALGLASGDLDRVAQQTL